MHQTHQEEIKRNTKTGLGPLGPRNIPFAPVMVSSKQESEQP
jgi:hypothetical protein